MPVFSDCVQRGTRAEQPEATTVTEGTLYYVIDESVTERSSGVSWQSFSPGFSSEVSPHHINHEILGNDPLKIDRLAPPDNTTSLNATTAAHGLLPRLSGLARDTLNGLGQWQAYGINIPAGTLAQQPGGLGPQHAGFLYQVLAPYFHTCRWNGTTWEFAPGDCGNGFFSQRPMAPQGGGWQICDGTVTDFLVVGGNMLGASSFNTPNLYNNQVYMKSWPGYDGAIIGAAGTITSGFGGASTGAGGASATDAGGGGSTGGYGGQTATTTEAGYHSHGGGTYEDGEHSHTGWTSEIEEHQHAVDAMTVGINGPFSNTDAGTNFFAARSDHTVTIPYHTTTAAGRHGHDIQTNPSGRHYHGIQADGSHTHQVGIADHTHALPVHTHSIAPHQHTVPDHVHTVPATEPAHIRVLVYFRR